MRFAPLLRHRLIASLACAALCVLTGAAARAASTAPRPASPTAYRDHLQALAALIAECRQHTDASRCRADAIGPDDIVTPTEHAAPREISYAWLRGIFDLIGNRKLAPADAAPLLKQAAARIQLEQAEAPGSSSPVPSPDRSASRSALTAILNRREFRHADPSLTDRVLDAIAIWINRRLSSLAAYSSHRRWLGLLLEWGIVALACVALAYWFFAQTRRARGLQAPQQAQADNAPGMRHWERLHRQAEQAAAGKHWREAVRCYYWAAIARFESRGQWSADRARTPREYLRLLLPDHPKHQDLLQLTRRLEACWYGSDRATQLDCDAARGLFERLAAR